MKTNRRIMLLILFIAGTGIFTLQAQNREERKELKEQTVKEKIESENYRIDINTAYPRRGRMIPLTSIYSVTIRNDSVFSQLPYFGRAYSIPYGGGQGLMFNAPIDQYTMAMGKRGADKNQLYRQKSRRSVQIQDNNLFQRFIQHRCRYAKP